LLLAGAILPFLMVLGYLKPNFPLIFITYGASLVGLFVGMIGVALYVGDNRDEYD
jgi:hypothetical protein